MIDEYNDYRVEQGVLYEHTTVRVPFSTTSDAPPVVTGAPSSPYGVAPYYFQRPPQPQSVAVRQPARTSELEAIIARQVTNGWEFLRVEHVVVKHDLDMRAYGSSTAVPTQAYYVLNFRRVKRPYGAE